MNHLILIVQQISIEEKIKNAPDKSYEIGILIGSFFPFIAFAGLAYFLYYKFNKKEKNLDS